MLDKFLNYITFFYTNPLFSFFICFWLLILVSLVFTSKPFLKEKIKIIFIFTLYFIATVFLYLSFNLIFTKWNLVEAVNTIQFEFLGDFYRAHELIQIIWLSNSLNLIFIIITGGMGIAYLQFFIPSTIIFGHVYIIYKWYTIGVDEYIFNNSFIKWSKDFNLNFCRWRLKNFIPDWLEESYFLNNKYHVIEKFILSHPNEIYVKSTKDLEKLFINFLEEEVALNKKLYYMDNCIYWVGNNQAFLQSLLGLILVPCGTYALYQLVSYLEIWRAMGVLYRYVNGIPPKPRFEPSNIHMNLKVELKNQLALNKNLFSIYKTDIEAHNKSVEKILELTRHLEYTYSIYDNIHLDPNNNLTEKHVLIMRHIMGMIKEISEAKTTINAGYKELPDIATLASMAEQTHTLLESMRDALL